ncbi:MAG: VWA domain-containing protein [Pyrinomonadaceae bacterium]|nr:VWA domain-containing protein [Pyrinomonadaceae bacterium]
MSKISQVFAEESSYFEGMRVSGLKKRVVERIKLQVSRRLSVFAAIVLCGFNLAAQVNAQKPDEDVIRVDTKLVAFEVSVTDKKGNPIRGLQAKDFDLFIDGQKRSIDFFKPIKKHDTDRPLSVVFALDVSGSVTKEELVKLRAAMQQFIKRLADYDSYFAVMTFGMQVKTLQSFTNKPYKLNKTFRKIIKSDRGLSTHAYDAVDDAIRLLRKKSPRSLNNKLPKRVVIVVTDGYPVGDTVSPSTVIERANNTETSVYAVILPSYSRLSGNGKPVLTLFEASGLVEQTGGRSFYAVKRDFEPLFRALAEEITASYALAFYPEYGEDSGKTFRKVEIKAADGFVVKQNRAGFQLKDDGQKRED